MRKYFWVLFPLLGFLMVRNLVYAVAEFRTAEVRHPLSEERRVTLTLPATAIEVAPSLFDLGVTSDVDGTPVRGFAFVHRKEEQAKVSNPVKGGGVKCYAFLASGAKWKSVENWIVNPQNTRALNGSVVVSTLAEDLGLWEDAADGSVGSGTGIAIFGSGSATDSALLADMNSPDGQNEVYFADVGDQGTIAVTIVWGVFGGPPSGRRLVKWDQVYDDVDFDWSSTGETGKMDLDNIVTHETGHSAGLGDVYEATCSDVTMYGYAVSGETKKQILEPADIKGISDLY